MPSSAKPAAIGPIDRGMAQALGVVALFFFQDDAGTAYEAITGRSLGLTNGSVVTDSAGKAVHFDGAHQSNAAFPLPAFTGNSTSTPSSLVMARFKPTAAQAANPGTAFGMMASTGQYGIGVGFDTSNNVGGGIQLNGNGAQIGASSAGALNTWYTVFAQVQSTTRSNAWINGAPATTQFTNDVGGGAAIDELSFGAQHRSAGAIRNFTGNLEWAAIIDMRGAALTDAQANALYDMDFPYSLLNNRKKEWLWAAAAAGGSFQAAWAVPSNFIGSGGYAT